MWTGTASAQIAGGRAAISTSDWCRNPTALALHRNQQAGKTSDPKYVSVSRQIITVRVWENCAGN